MFKLIKKILRKIFKMKRYNYCYIFYIGRHVHIIKRFGYRAYLRQIFDNLEGTSELIFTHGMGGGTDAYFLSYAKNVINTSSILKISSIPFSNYVILHLYQKNRAILDFYVKFGRIIKYLNNTEFAKIKIINLACYKNLKQIFSFIEKYKTYNKNTVVHFDIHDYYCLCPSWYLLDNNGNFCNMNTDSNKCKKCLSKTLLKYGKTNNVDINKWRSSWKTFIEHYVDKVLVFSNSSNQIIQKFFALDDSKILFEPHINRPTAKYRIAIIGSIMKCKGSGILKNIIQFLESNFVFDFHFVLVGPNFDGINSDFGLTTSIGEYNINDLRCILNNLCIDAIFIPSPWPETFSYTTLESITLSYPVICFDMGGQSDQVKKYAKGIVLNSKDPKYVLTEISNFLNKINNKKVC